MPKARKAAPAGRPSFHAPPITLELKLSSQLPITPEELAELRAFMQSMLYRAGVGNVRYGPPAARKRYLTRMRKELAAYTKTGNAEHLFNIAVYCWLETMAPQHPKQHWDAAVESATRAEMGGHIA